MQLLFGLAILSILIITLFTTSNKNGNKTFTPSAMVYEDELKILRDITKLDILNAEYKETRSSGRLFEITIAMKDKEKFVIAMSDPYSCERDENGDYLLDKENNKVYLARLR